MNNALSIIRNWKRLYHKYGVNRFAQMVENATQGEYPDSSLYQSPSVEIKGMTEDELIMSDYKFI